MGTPILKFLKILKLPFASRHRLWCGQTEENLDLRDLSRNGFTADNHSWLELQTTERKKYVATCRNPHCRHEKEKGRLIPQPDRSATECPSCKYALVWKAWKA